MNPVPFTIAPHLLDHPLLLRVHADGYPPLERADLVLTAGEKTVEIRLRSRPVAAIKLRDAERRSR
jgi:hypothetical protein